jgi:hypothetical protein
VTAAASVILYLLATNAVVCALVAWSAPGAAELVIWVLGLGILHLLGEKLGESFDAVEAKRRGKIAVFLGTIQLSVLVLSLVLAAAKPSPGLLSFLTTVMTGYQLVAVLLNRLTPHPRGVVGQSLALVALASLRGGPLAAWAVSSAFALTALYVGVEHHLRLLVAHRAEPDPHTGTAVWRSAVLALPVALVVGLAVWQADPVGRQFESPRDEEGYVPLDEKKGRHELDMRALRITVLAGVGGAIAVYFLGRMLNRSRGGEPKAIETPEPLRGRLERIRPESRRSRAIPDYPGRRGRIVRAYLNLLRGAERAGFPRAPHETPGEFAGALRQPQAALETATEVFVRARYGREEPSDEDVAQAEGGSDAVLAHLARQPPRKRRGVVRDAETTKDDGGAT